MRLLKNRDYNKEQIFLFLVFVSMSVLNFGNYSFLSYNFNGTPTSFKILVYIKELRILLPIVCILYLMLKDTWKSKVSLVIKNNAVFIFLCFLFLINSFGTSDILNSIIYSVWLLASVVLILLVVKEVFTINDLIRLLKYGSLVTLFLTLLSIPQVLISGPEATFFSSKNYYAYPLLIYFLCELSLFRSELNQKKVFVRIFILGLVLILLFLSGRRTPTACAFIAFLIYLYSYKKLLFIGLALGIVFFGSVLFTTDFFGFRIKDSLTFQRTERISNNQNFEDSSYSAREILWNAYLLGFQDSPIIGNGLNTHETTLGKYYKGELEGLGYHNTFLQVLVEAGIIGFLFLAFYLLRCIINLFRSQNGWWYFILFIPTLLINWVETNFLPGQIFFMYSITIWGFLYNLPSLENKQNTVSISRSDDAILIN